MSALPPPAMLEITCLRRVRPWGGDPVDIAMADGVITAITPAGTAPIGVREFDGRGLLALPGLVNAHAHLDKSWWGLPWQSYGGEGSTEGRIRHERAERDRLGIPSLERSAYVLRELVRHGTTAIRTHVDVDAELGLRGIDAVDEAAAAYQGALDVRIVAFPQDGILRRPGVLDLLREAATRPSVEWIGGLDPATIDRDPVGQIDAIAELAADTGAGIDIHLHDPAELGAFQIELLVDRAARLGLAGRVNVAHGFAVAQLDPARRRDLLAAMAEVGVTMTTVAPLRVPQLPLAELDAAGVRFAFGTDGIRDLWSPYGTGDTLGIAWQYARAAGLARDEDLLRVMRLATSAGAWAVGREVHDLVEGARADIVLVEAENPLDALVRVPERMLVVAGGSVLHVA
ncbi:amidohydrolase family protein [Microbacterium sp. SORGH_AS_0421]|uniref:amidohydrolase family protein n=1 Tax=Microbacterium sp. SORGH_AS_0421 TaxID=3041768 RepID=UPI00279329DF|nr:amidohydrolase family protein [Microbacterium sp. SORGH_AS_0421]MDQ1177718.1 cytosine deaminase [Microbacterium sp. SORGH_AS_0421]